MPVTVGVPHLFRGGTYLLFPDRVSLLLLTVNRCYFSCPQSLSLKANFFFEGTMEEKAKPLASTVSSATILRHVAERGERARLFRRRMIAGHNQHNGRCKLRHLWWPSMFLCLFPGGRVHPRFLVGVVCQPSFNSALRRRTKRSRGSSFCVTFVNRIFSYFDGSRARGGLDARQKGIQKCLNFASQTDRSMAISV